jgi:hypothetical protein
MRSRLALVFLSFCAMYCLSALADERTDGQIAAAAVQEARELLARELFGHYDIVNLSVLKIEALRNRMPLGQDYGLLMVTLAFSTTRNTTRHPSLNPSLFEPGSSMCQGGLYLHCGVRAGHVFDGTLQLVLAVDKDGIWRAVSPHWRSRREYPLDGYLLLDGRDKEGYVLFSRPRAH